MEGPKKEIYKVLCDTITDVLNVDAEDCKPEASILGDLGAESIDLMDLSFRIENKFGIKFDIDELVPGFKEEELALCVEDGKITTYGITQLEVMAPYVAFRKNGDLTFDGTVSGIVQAFTVMSLVDFIHDKIKGKSSEQTAAG